MGFRGRRPLTIVGVTIAFFVLGVMMLRALSKVMSGHGLDTYRNYRGALLSYNGAVVAGIALLIGIVVAFGMKWWHERQERKYEAIVRARESAANTAAKKTP